MHFDIIHDWEFGFRINLSNRYCTGGFVLSLGRLVIWAGYLD